MEKQKRGGVGYLVGLTVSRSLSAGGDLILLADCSTNIPGTVASFDAYRTQYKLHKMRVHRFENALKILDNAIIAYAALLGKFGAKGIGESSKAKNSLAKILDEVKIWSACGAKDIARIIVP